MAKRFNREAAEREANEIAFQFQNSHDVVGDMSRAYHTDFSGIRMHEDDAAQARVSSAGTDALAKGSDIYFKKGILSGNDPASRGLVAHELAHTMQQGIVAGDVAESAPAGAEQGGFLDWIKGAFNRKKKPKYRHMGGQVASDEASLAYMEVMHAKEAQLREQRAQQEARYRQMWPQRRADALASAGPVNNRAISPELSEQYAKLAPEAVEKSDVEWDLSFLKDNADRVPLAYNMFGYNQTGRGIGKVDQEMRGNAFSGMKENYGNYLNSLAENGADFQMMTENLDKLSTESGKKYEYNDYTIDMAKDLYGITSNYLLSDSGLDYASNLISGLEDAEVFDEEEESGQTPLDFVLKNVIQHEGVFQGNDQGQNQAKNKFSKLGRNAMFLPIEMTAMSEEERQTMPPQVQSLFAQYEDIKKRIAEALAARNPAAAKASA